MNQPKPDTRHTFTLKRLLLAVLLFGVFCGLARLASADGIRIAALPAIISLAFAAGVLTHRYIVSLAVTLVLAMASFVTTSMIWDGGFPFAELRITVVDDRGKALDDVKMSVTSHRRGHPAVGYPIAEYEGVPLITDSNGVITCHQTRSGLQFGGTRGSCSGAYRWDSESAVRCPLRSPCTGPQDSVDLATLLHRRQSIRRSPEDDVRAGWATGGNAGVRKADRAHEAIDCCD